MKRKILILLVVLANSFADTTISFNQLVALAAKDSHKNIYLDKSIKDYEITLNLSNHQKKGEIFELFKDVLADNLFELKYNQAKDYYTVVEGVGFNAQKFESVDPAVVIHFYSYRVRNLTAKDISSALSIFPNITYKYLPSSNLIAYSATLQQHKDIKKIIHQFDNNIKSKDIRITIFLSSSNFDYSQGTDISKFGIEIDSSNTFQIRDALQFSAYISSMAEKGDVKIVQSPRFHLLNGVETAFKSVKTIPYINTTATVEDAKQSTTEEVEYRDVGLQLRLFPTIKKDFVYLDINLTSEEVLDLNNDKPITQKIEYMSSVRVLEDKSILLTGLNKSNTSTVVNSVPLFNSIPIVGGLFSLNSKDNTYMHLNILIESIGINAIDFSMF